MITIKIILAVTIVILALVSWALLHERKKKKKYKAAQKQWETFVDTGNCPLFNSHESIKAGIKEWRSIADQSSIKAENFGNSRIKHIKPIKPFGWFSWDEITERFENMPRCSYATFCGEPFTYQDVTLDTVGFIDITLKITYKCYCCGKESSDISCIYYDSNNFYVCKPCLKVGLDIIKERVEK